MIENRFSLKRGRSQKIYTIGYPCEWSYHGLYQNLVVSQQLQKIGLTLGKDMISTLADNFIELLIFSVVASFKQEEKSR